MMGAVLHLGARKAEPGEFTQRAFMNGRIDLTEAEAVRDTIEAETSAQLRLANSMRDGALHNKLAEISDELVGVLAAIEASVDFSEELGDVEPESQVHRLKRVSKDIQELLSTADVGRITRNGLRIAIVGPPNAGKSSLMNRVLGRERSIVTEIPGTTRDYVEERAELLGFPVVLTDTAGLRDTGDAVEQIGIQRARALAANADLIWLVLDSTQTLISDDYGFERPMIRIANKADLAEPPEDSLAISCLTGQGLDELYRHTAMFFEMPLGFAIQTRHESDLFSANEELQLAIEALQFGRPPDLAATGIRAALESIGRITGETADSDIIARIFRDFCIGK